jgi:hypothetical protein
MYKDQPCPVFTTMLATRRIRHSSGDFGALPQVALDNQGNRHPRRA